MKKTNKSWIPVTVFTIILLAILLLLPGKSSLETTDAGQEQLDATITEELSSAVTEGFNGPEKIQTFALELNEDSEDEQLKAGQNLELEHSSLVAADDRNYQIGDQVVLVRQTGIENETGELLYIFDHKRTDALLWLTVIFVIAVLAVTRTQGIGAIIGMILSFLILFKIVLIQILSGTNPVTATLLGATLITPSTFFLSHGINRKTITAVIGTIITLIVTGLIAKFFAEFAHLSGLASEEANFLSIGAKENIDFQGLVLAGMIISILGVLDDITISQASVVEQLRAVNKKLKIKELFTRAMNVGRDHIASLVNTLILVYAGASLPLLLLFMDNEQSFGEIINLEFMSTEIIETLVGSIGLVLAVPITTILACYIIKKGKAKPHDHISGCCH